MPPEFPASDTFLARRALRFIDFGTAEGLDRKELLAVASLTEEQLGDPDQRIQAGVIWRLSGFLAQRLGDPDLGIRMGAAARIQKGGGLISYSITHSRDLRHALERLVRYSRLIAGASRLSLSPEDGGYRLLAERSSLVSMLRLSCDDSLASVVTACRQITGSELAPLRVELPYPKPASVEAHRAHFRSTLWFDQPRPAIIFEAKDLRLPLVAADETLSAYLDRLAEQELALLEVPETWVDRVKAAVWRDLADGSPSLARVASDLGVGARTLQRRLREEDATFAEVVDDVRRAMAGALLRRPDLAIYEIAYMVGYAEPSTFYRAFRRWHGRSPEETRQLWS